MCLRQITPTFEKLGQNTAKPTLETVDSFDRFQVTYKFDFVFHYPKHYKVDPPKHIDWRYEKVIKLNYTDKNAGGKKIEYRIVPKKHLIYRPDQNYCEGIQFSKNHKHENDTCKEVYLDLIKTK